MIVQYVRNRCCIGNSLNPQENEQDRFERDFQAEKLCDYAEKLVPARKVGNGWISLK